MIYELIIAALTSLTCSILLAFNVNIFYGFCFAIVAVNIKTIIDLIGFKRRYKNNK